MPYNNFKDVIQGAHDAQKLASQLQLKLEKAKIDLLAAIQKEQNTDINAQLNDHLNKIIALQDQIAIAVKIQQNIFESWVADPSDIATKYAMYKQVKALDVINAESQTELAVPLLYQANKSLLTSHNQRKELRESSRAIKKDYEIIRQRAEVYTELEPILAQAKSLIRASKQQSEKVQMLSKELKKDPANATLQVKFERNINILNGLNRDLKSVKSQAQHIIHKYNIGNMGNYDTIPSANTPAQVATEPTKGIASPLASVSSRSGYSEVILPPQSLVNQASSAVGSPQPSIRRSLAASNLVQSKTEQAIQEAKVLHKSLNEARQKNKEIKTYYQHPSILNLLKSNVFINNSGNEIFRQLPAFNEALKSHQHIISDLVDRLSKHPDDLQALQDLQQAIAKSRESLQLVAKIHKQESGFRANPLIQQEANKPRVPMVQQSHSTHAFKAHEQKSKKSWKQKAKSVFKSKKHKTKQRQKRP